MAVVALLTGCATVFTGIVTVTQVVDSGMRQWAALSKAGKTSAELDNRVIAAHDTYRQQATLAQAALKTYKATNDAKDLQTALGIARDAADPLIDLIAGVLSPSKSARLKANLNQAIKP